MRTVGFIGLGNMGRAAARNLQRAGFGLVVHDIRREAGAPLEEHGAVWADSPAEVAAKADVIFTMVFGPAQITEVIRGESGLIAGGMAGKVWVDMTTSEPFLMRELGAEVVAAGGDAVDAPVTGSVDSAIRGDMILFVGGADAAVANVQPMLDAVGVTRRVGQHGNGYVAKLVNNQLWFVHAAAIGEAMVTAKLAGLEPDIWWAAMKGGAADSFVMAHDVPSIFAGHYDPSFRLALCLKDLGLINGLMDAVGSRSEMTDATYARFREAGERYGQDAGEMTVCKLIEEDAGVALRVDGDWAKPWEVKHPSER